MERVCVCQWRRGGGSNCGGDNVEPYIKTQSVGLTLLTFLIIPFRSQKEEGGEGVCFGNGERSGRRASGGGDDVEP